MRAQIMKSWADSFRLCQTPISNLVSSPAAIAYECVNSHVSEHPVGSWSMHGKSCSQSTHPPHSSSTISRMKSISNAPASKHKAASPEELKLCCLPVEI